MNIFDYFFSYSKDLKKDFFLGPSEQISYCELYEKGLKLANYLNKETGENKNIILIGQNSIFFLIAYLGIMKSGNVCVPLNSVIEQKNLDFDGLINYAKQHSEDDAWRETAQWLKKNILAPRQNL